MNDRTSAPKSPVDDRGPLILAMETAGQCGSLALVGPDGCLAEHSLLSRITHSRRLLTGIEKMLADCDLCFEDLQGIAISIGPGSFTGLRIGLSTAKGLALATGLPLISVPTLDGLACQLAFTEQPICAVMDARKKELFAAFYHWHKTDGLVKKTDYLALPPSSLVEQIKSQTIFIGDGIGTYGDYLSEELGKKALFAPPQLYFARAAAIGRVALEKWQEKEFMDPARCVPLYVRPSEAEINLRKKRESVAGR